MFYLSLIFYLIEDDQLFLNHRFLVTVFVSKILMLDLIDLYEFFQIIHLNHLKVNQKLIWLVVNSEIDFGLLYWVLSYQLSDQINLVEFEIKYVDVLNQMSVRMRS